MFSSTPETSAMSNNKKKVGFKCTLSLSGHCNVLNLKSTINVKSLHTKSVSE